MIVGAYLKTERIEVEIPSPYKKCLNENCKLDSRNEYLFMGGDFCHNCASPLISAPSECIGASWLKDVLGRELEDGEHDQLHVFSYKDVTVIYSSCYDSRLRYASGIFEINLAKTTEAVANFQARHRALLDEIQQRHGGSIHFGVILEPF